jgi:hypothetical protein
VRTNAFKSKIHLASASSTQTGSTLKGGVHTTGKARSRVWCKSKSRCASCLVQHDYTLCLCVCMCVSVCVSMYVLCSDVLPVSARAVPTYPISKCPFPHVFWVYISHIKMPISAFAVPTYPISIFPFQHVLCLHIPYQNARFRTCSVPTSAYPVLHGRCLYQCVQCLRAVMVCCNVRAHSICVCARV